MSPLRWGHPRGLLVEEAPIAVDREIVAAGEAAVALVRAVSLPVVVDGVVVARQADSFGNLEQQISITTHL